MRAKALSVKCTPKHIILSLEDKRVVQVPIAWFPKLKGATPKERNAFRLVADGAGIRWDAIDEDMAVAQMVDPSSKPLEDKGRFKCRSCGHKAAVKWTFTCPGCNGFYDIIQSNNRRPEFGGGSGGGSSEDDSAIALNQVYAPPVDRLTSDRKSVV